jgi:hypothetical protein
MMISGKIGFDHDNSISSALIGNAEDSSNFDVKEASLLLGIFQLVLLILFYTCSGLFYMINCLAIEIFL